MNTPSPAAIEALALWKKVMVEVDPMAGPTPEQRKQLDELAEKACNLVADDFLDLYSQHNVVQRLKLLTSKLIAAKAYTGRGESRWVTLKIYAASRDRIIKDLRAAIAALEGKDDPADVDIEEATSSEE